MNDHPAQPAPETGPEPTVREDRGGWISGPSASPEVTAVATVGAVLTDLVDLAERLPVPPGQAETVATQLDRLSQEIAEAAQMLRGVTAPGIGTGGADLKLGQGPSCDPWAIVTAVMRELAGDGVKTRFGADTDLTAACGHAAGLLEALGVVPVVTDPA